MSDQAAAQIVSELHRISDALLLVGVSLWFFIIGKLIAWLVRFPESK